MTTINLKLYITAKKTKLADTSEEFSDLSWYAVKDGWMYEIAFMKPYSNQSDFLVHEDYITVDIAYDEEGMVQLATKKLTEKLQATRLKAETEIQQVNDELKELQSLSYDNA